MMIRTFLLLILISTAAVQAPAQPIYAENQIPARGVAIEYEVTIRNPVSHIYDVLMSIRGVREGSIDVAMPAWSPGAYRIENYARNVQDFRAANQRGQALLWQKTDKQTWRISKQPADDVEIRYQVFSNLLTYDMADLSGPATFMYAVGQKHVPVRVKYTAPSGWRVHTGLNRNGDWYHAGDYDIFVDAPAFIGDFKVLEFQSAAGIPHRLVFSKRDMALSEEQVIADVKDIVEATTSIFGKAPYDQYVFLMKVLPQPGSGGLEHLNSTRITVGENDLINLGGYRRFLFVVAHEFFHLWNVKRIRPVGLGPFDYTKEVYTGLLWLSEGSADYYAHLLLTRAGIMLPEEFYGFIGNEINTLQHQPGRSLMSAEESSWNAWLTSDNAVNNTISYYNKGQVIAMLLDLEIRGRTGNQKSMDDVWRHLLQNYADKGIGFTEEQFLSALEAVTGSDFREFIALTAQGRQELEYNRYLRHAGLQIDITGQPPGLWVGIEYDRTESNLARVRRILPNSPAQRAQLDAGDILTAMNDDRLTYDNFRSRLLSHPIGSRVRLTVLRGERLLTLEITPVEFQEQRWGITPVSNTTPAQLELRNAWLGVR
jgi:predicted metalloprotease with PDZ domain